MACGPSPSDDRSPATSVVTTSGCGADAAVGVATAAATGKADDVFNTVVDDDEPCTDEAADGLGADTRLRTGVEAAKGFELRMGGGAVLVVVEPVASSL